MDNLVQKLSNSFLILEYAINDMGWFLFIAFIKLFHAGS